MKPFVLIALLFFSFFGNAQETEEFQAPRYSKQAIGESGVSLYLPKVDNLEVDKSMSEDSSEVYTVDVAEGNYHYAAIVVKLNGMVLLDQEDKEELLIGYLDYLMTSFSITGAAGYGKGHTLASDPTAIGIIDYWQDETDEWAIKAWANETHLAILMVYGPGNYPNFNALQVYLDGVRFDK
jgi:hypothetical protein